MSCRSPQHCSNCKSTGRERRMSWAVLKSYSCWAPASWRPNTWKRRRRHLQPCQHLPAPTPICLQQCCQALPACSVPFAPSERKQNSCKNKTWHLPSSPPTKYSLKKKKFQKKMLSSIHLTNLHTRHTLAFGSGTQVASNRTSLMP